MNIKKHNDRKISEVLAEYIQKNKRIQIQHNLKHIEDAWRSEMGEMINKYTSGFFIKDGRLSVTISSAPIRSELNMSRHKIVELLNEKIGSSVIKELILR